jgi:outer membrane receptor for ferrienterochelin and colicin
VPAYTFNGNYTSEALADLLIGQVYQFDANTQAVVEQLQNAWSGFVQDDWKVARNFTVNLGMRYEYVTPYYGARPNVISISIPRPGNW